MLQVSHDRLRSCRDRGSYNIRGVPDQNQDQNPRIPDQQARTSSPGQSGPKVLEGGPASSVSNSPSEKFFIPR